MTDLPVLRFFVPPWAGLVAAQFLPQRYIWIDLLVVAAAVLLLMVAWLVADVHREKKPVPQPEPDVSSINTDRLAAGVDDLVTLAGAGIAYRRRLEELGYSPTMSEQIAAHAVLHMQEQAFGGGR